MKFDVVQTCAQSGSLAEPQMHDKMGFEGPHMHPCLEKHEPLHTHKVLVHRSL